MTNKVRAVFDTNIYISASLSKNQNSVAQDLFLHWRAKTFTLLVCDQLLDEIVEKLLEKRVDPAKIRVLLAGLGELAEWIKVSSDAILPVTLADSDDDVIVACAVIEKADYLVSNDKHFDVLGEVYWGIRITRPLPFLWVVRRSQALESGPTSDYPA